MEIAVNRIDQILGDYEARKGLYEGLCGRAEKLLHELVESNGIPVHSISSRLKANSSVRDKVSQVEKYVRLADVTDIVGLRIITYFADHVDKVADLVEKEFQIDKENSIDKRAALDPDRFGYLSLHYVCSFHSSRSSLTEYTRFRDLTFEIQVRSILQHTWAEMEHDLGYKSKQAIPKNIRRRFSRLAGLLEMADDEFCAIRDSLLSYETNLPQQIADTPSEVTIDQASINAFISTNTLVKEIDDAIAKAGFGIVSASTKIPDHTAELMSIGIYTIGELEAALRRNQQTIAKFANSFFDKQISRLPNPGPHPVSFPHGVCLFHLGYFLAAQSGVQALNDLIISRKLTQKGLTERVMAAYSESISKH